jgi:hypothetical protein
MTIPTDKTKKSNFDFYTLGHLYKNIDVTFFESIISGHLRPFLPLYDSSDELQNLLTIKVEDKFDIEELQKWNQNGCIPKEILEKFNVIDGDNISITINEQNNTLLITFSKPEDTFDLLFDIDIPDPPDEKAQAFLNLIELEFDLMKRKAQKALDLSISSSELALYAIKNFQRLKEIAPRVETLYRKLYSKNNNFLVDSNLYIIYITKEYIIRAIMFYQQMFFPLLNCSKEDYSSFRSSLYGEIRSEFITKHNLREFEFLKFENLKEIFEYVNDGIFQIELFLGGNLNETKTYNLTGAFSRLIVGLRKPENSKQENLDLLVKYWQILEKIESDITKTKYFSSINPQDVYFKKICIEIPSILESVFTFLEENNIIPEPGCPAESVTELIDISFDEKYLKAYTNIPEEKRKTKKEFNSFSYKKYSNNLPALTDLLNSLKHYKLVASDNDLSDFRKIFNNETPSKPIKWIGNISELFYFIKLLHYDFDLISNLKGNIWKITSKIFVDSCGNSFDWKKFRSLKNSANVETIEKCVSLLIS